MADTLDYMSAQEYVITLQLYPHSSPSWYRIKIRRPRREANHIYRHAIGKLPVLKLALMLLLAVPPYIISVTVAAYRR